MSIFGSSAKFQTMRVLAFCSSLPHLAVAPKVKLTLSEGRLY